MAPTFRDGDELRVEALLIDYPGGELYDQRASVGFIGHLRGESRFPSAEALVAQIHKDVDASRVIGAGAAEPLC